MDNNEKGNNKFGCCGGLPAREYTECGTVEPQVKSVKFNPETKEVFDEFNNYIGQGELNNGTLFIVRHFPI